MMNWVRAIALLLALAVHGSLLLYVLGKSDAFSLQQGSGRDDLTIVATVSLENDNDLGLDVQTQEAKQPTAAIAPAQNRENPEPKKDEPLEPVKPQQDEALEEEKPPQETETQPKEAPAPTPVEPQKQAALPQAATEAQEDQHAGRSLDARKTHLASLYQSQIFMALIRHRINPNSALTGRVVVLAKIAPSGQLISRDVAESSGSAVLDRAALATVEMSAPFPAIPKELGSEPITLRVPFEYSTR